MVAYKAAQTAAFLRSPTSGCDAMLLYGPDAGLVSDRARALASRLAENQEPQGEIVRLGERDLADDPDRLVVETQTLPMFGGRKVVHVRAGQRIDAAALQPLLEQPLEAALVVEAGNLAPSAKLRKIFETAAGAAALPCYGDPGRDLGPLIDEILQDRGLTIAPDARTYLMAQLGADHAVSRAEIEKLALYADGKDAVTDEDVDAVVADAALAAHDVLANAAAAGDAAGALRQLDRLLASGTSAQAVLAVLTRHFGRLHRISAQLEAGTPLKTVLGRLRPPLHFKQRDAITAQSRRWDQRRTARALDRIQETVRRSRRSPELERQFTERLILVIARTG